MDAGVCVSARIKERWSPGAASPPVPPKRLTLGPGYDIVRLRRA
jgi:hypothetical protein